MSEQGIFEAAQRNTPANICHVPGCNHLLASHGQDMSRKPVCRECVGPKREHTYEPVPRSCGAVFPPTGAVCAMPLHSDEKDHIGHGFAWRSTVAPPQPDAKPLTDDVHFYHDRCGTTHGGMGPNSDRIDGRLAECPMCGRAPVLTVSCIWAKVECRDYDGSGGCGLTLVRYYSKGSIIEAWNRRDTATIDALRAERDAVAKQRDAVQRDLSETTTAWAQAADDRDTYSGKLAAAEKQSALRADVLALAHRLLADVVADPHPVSPRRIKETMRRIEEALR